MSYCVRPCNRQQSRLADARLASQHEHPIAVGGLVDDIAEDVYFAIAPQQEFDTHGAATMSAL
jgi:hypothetical protein